MNCSTWKRGSASGAVHYRARTTGGVHRATTSPISLDESFFRVRFVRLTPAEKLDRAVTSLGPTRGSLIGKGMVWSPNHGDTAFTVPVFDEFMHRIMPGGDWRE